MRFSISLKRYYSSRRHLQIITNTIRFIQHDLTLFFFITFEINDFNAVSEDINDSVNCQNSPRLSENVMKIVDGNRFPVYLDEKKYLYEQICGISRITRTIYYNNYRSGMLLSLQLFFLNVSFIAMNDTNAFHACEFKFNNIQSSFSQLSTFSILTSQYYRYYYFTF